MSKSPYVDEPLSAAFYKANSVPSSFKKYADYLLIGWHDNYVDVKRIWPVMWLYIVCGMGIYLLTMFFLMESYSYYLWSNIADDETRLEAIIRRIVWKFNKERYSHFFFSLFIPLILLYYGLRLFIGRYPTPLRFNKKNDLVYFKRYGRVWVTSWDKGYVKLWRFANVYSAQRVFARGLAIRLLSIDKKGELLVRWEPVASIDNHSLYFNEALGGEPTLLYWRWLNAYMQGEELDKPKVGRQGLFEKLRFFNYKFPKSVDEQAEQLQQQLIENNLYPKPNKSWEHPHKVPLDPYFPHEDDFPDLARAPYQIYNKVEKKETAPMPEWQKRGFSQWKGALPVNEELEEK
jgi:hypothetical protein